MLKGLVAIKDRCKRARTIAAEIDTPEKKRLFNQQHFAVSAKRYDLATRAMSLGRDRSWKKHLIAALPQGGTPTCLDLATGSGDVALLLAQAYPKGQVTGIDLTAEMLQLAQERNVHDHLDLFVPIWQQRGWPTTASISSPAATPCAMRLICVKF